jgi:hypothetical protein
MWINDNNVFITSGSNHKANLKRLVIPWLDNVMLEYIISNDRLIRFNIFIS